MKKKPNPRFLKHIALTKAKPLPAERWVPQRTLAEALGVAPETKLTSLPLPDIDTPPVVSRETLADAIPTKPGESLVETVREAREAKP